MVIGICNFEIAWNLRIVIWDFSAVSGKADHFYLNQLELTLTNPCWEGRTFDSQMTLSYNCIEKGKLVMISNWVATEILFFEVPRSGTLYKITK